jgi:hypothetical protein
MVCPLSGDLDGTADRPVVAERGHRSDATERPLISVLQSSTREGPLRIIEPPFLAADRSAADDPERSVDFPEVRLP